LEVVGDVCARKVHVAQTVKLLSTKCGHRRALKIFNCGAMSEFIYNVLYFKNHVIQIISFFQFLKAVGYKPEGRGLDSR